MNKNTEQNTKYKIKVIVNGVILAYNECTLFPLDDDQLIKFSDRFNIVYVYNKSLLISMEVLK